MPRVATVEIKHKKSGKTRLINKKDYDPKGAHLDWAIAETRSRAQMQESDEKPPSAPDPAAANEAAPEAPSDPEEDWRKMKWPQARQHVKAKTGTTPKSKAHAEELMAD